MTNKELDAKVLAAITTGCKQMGRVCTNVYRTIAPSMEQQRAVDRSLQRLRRAGQATYSRKDGWSVMLVRPIVPGLEKP